MKKKIIIILLALCHYPLFSQTVVSGRVIDEQHKPVAYANIGIPFKGIGTVSDEQGKFLLKVPKTLNNELITISHVGFETIESPVNTLDGLIVLKTIPLTLQNISVEGKQMKSKELGNRSKAGFLISGFSYDDLGGEVGSKFSIKHKSYITETGFYIKSNSFDMVKLRLKIYSIKSKLPHKLLSSEEYLTLSIKEEGQVTYQLQHIVETDDDVIVTVEMVDRYPVNRGAIYFSQSPPYLGKMYYRETSFDRVEKYIGGPMSMYLKIKYEK